MADVKFQASKKHRDERSAASACSGHQQGSWRRSCIAEVAAMSGITIAAPHQITQLLLHDQAEGSAAALCAKAGAASGLPTGCQHCMKLRKVLHSFSSCNALERIAAYVVVTFQSHTLEALDHCFA